MILFKEYIYIYLIHMRFICIYIYIHTCCSLSMYLLGVSSAFEVSVFQLGGSGARLAGLKEVNFLHLGSVIGSHFSGVIQNYQYFWGIKHDAVFFW